MFEPAFLAFACQHAAALALLRGEGKAPYPELIAAADAPEALAVTLATLGFSDAARMRREQQGDPQGTLPDGTPAWSAALLARCEALAWQDAARLWRAAEALSESLRLDPEAWLDLQRFVERALAEEVVRAEADSIDADLSSPLAFPLEEEEDAGGKKKKRQKSLPDALLDLLARRYSQEEATEKKKKMAGDRFAGEAVPALLAPFVEQVRLAREAADARRAVARWTGGDPLPALAALPDAVASAGRRSLLLVGSSLDQDLDELLRLHGGPLASFSAWHALVRRAFDQVYVPAAQRVRQTGKATTRRRLAHGKKKKEQDENAVSALAESELAGFDDLEPRLLEAEDAAYALLLAEARKGCSAFLRAASERMLRARRELIAEAHREMDAGLRTSPAAPPVLSLPPQEMARARQLVADACLEPWSRSHAEDVVTRVSRLVALPLLAAFFPTAKKKDAERLRAWQATAPARVVLDGDASLRALCDALDSLSFPAQKQGDEAARAVVSSLQQAAVSLHGPDAIDELQARDLLEMMYGEHLELPRLNLREDWMDLVREPPAPVIVVPEAPMQVSSRRSDEEPC